MNCRYFAGQMAPIAPVLPLRCQPIAAGGPRATEEIEATDCRVFSTHFPPTL